MRRPIESRAVVAGVSEYASGRLPNAVSDASAVADLLARGYKFRLYPETGLFNGDATPARLEDAVVQSLERADASTRWLFYFAGHGDPGYLVLADDAAGRRYGALSSAWLIERCLESRCGEILIVLDTCYAGEILVRPELPASEERSTERGTLQVLAAGGRRQTVSDAGGDGHSIFTQFLVNALDGWAGIHDDAASASFTALREYMDENLTRILKPDEQQLLGVTLRMAYASGRRRDFQLESRWPLIPRAVIAGTRSSDPAVRGASLAKLAASCRPQRSFQGQDLVSAMERNLQLAIRLAQEVLENGAFAIEDIDLGVHRQLARSLGELGRLGRRLREQLEPRTANGITSRITESLLHLVVHADRRVHRTACRSLARSLDNESQLRIGNRLDALRPGSELALERRLWTAMAMLPGWRGKQSPLLRAQARGTLLHQAAADGWLLIVETRWLRWFLSGVATLLALVTVALGTTYYAAVGERSEVVIRRGLPGFEMIPGVGSPIAVTDYETRDLRDPALAQERVIGSWWLRRDGVFDWGHRLAEALGPGQASLALWRLGARKRALRRLAEELAAQETASFPVAVYLALHSEAAAELAVEPLLRGLESEGKTVREEARQALEQLRRIRPDLALPLLERSSREPAPAAEGQPRRTERSERLPAPRTRDALIVAASDADDDVRADAIHALVDLALDGGMESQDLEPVLATALRDRRDWIRHEAAEGILLLAERPNRLHETACRELLGQIERVWHRRLGYGELFRRSPPMAAALFGQCLLGAAASAEDVSVYRFFEELRDLVTYHPEILPELAVPLTELLTGPVRGHEPAEAVWRIKTLLDELGLDPTPLAERFLAQLRSASVTDRRAAAEVLGGLVSSSPELISRTLPELESAMSDPDSGVVARLAQSWFWIGLAGDRNDRIMAILLRGIRDSRPDVRSSYFRTLNLLNREGLMMSRSLLDAVAESAADPEEEVRAAVVWILARQGLRLSGERTAAVELLRKRLRQEETMSVRLDLATSLSMLAGGDEAIVDQIFAVASVGLEDAEHAFRAAHVLTTLVKANPTRVPRAIRTLRSCCHQTAFNPSRVLRQIGEIDPESGALAIEALGDILLRNSKLSMRISTLRAIEELAEVHGTLNDEVMEILEDLLDEPSRHLDFRGSSARSREELWVKDAWRLWVELAVDPAVRDPGIIKRKLVSPSRAERLAGLEVAGRLLAEQPESASALEAVLAGLRSSPWPHLRQAVATVQEMVAVLRETEARVSDPKARETWGEVLDWLARHGFKPILEPSTSRLEPVNHNS